MRDHIKTLDRKFADLKIRTVELVLRAGDGRLYIRAGGGNTIGELILRSAGAVEQMIGGVTRRLWDDPFEWTLPERMTKASDIAAYLEEVEAARRDGFLFFKSDEDLAKILPAPIELRSIQDVLTETLERANSFHAEAENLLDSMTK